jgi:hypothetical protein
MCNNNDCVKFFSPIKESLQKQDIPNGEKMPIRVITCYVDTKYLFESDRQRYVFNQHLKEKDMNYTQAVEKAREGKRLRRTSWEESQYMWSNGKILIHNTPYWTNEYINQELQGYPYVCEQVDVVANDWETCAA